MTEVERIFNELTALRELTAKAESPSDLNAFETLAAKSLLLAAASYFERQICDSIENTARSTGSKEPFVNFISRQGLKRRYHQLFNWEMNHANQFLGLFGPECKKLMDDDIKADETLSQAIKDFMYLGSQRNQLVHNNFASFPVDASLSEIWMKFQSASKFAEWLPKKLTAVSTAKREENEPLAENAGQDQPAPTI
ncbi:MAG: hypothetical protein JSR99_19010 [Proteobacteria bacterium]|nr:hypothetical protein [Pseudomonadota bacterium]